MKTFFKHTIVSLFLMVSGFAFAQIPDTQYSEGISYISGGVGDGESEAILAETKQWPVLLELSQLESGRGRSEEHTSELQSH